MLTLLENFARISQLIAQGAHGLGLVDSPVVNEVSHEEADTLSPPCGRALGDQCAAGFSARSSAAGVVAQWTVLHGNNQGGSGAIGQASI